MDSELPGGASVRLDTANYPTGYPCLQFGMMEEDGEYWADDWFLIGALKMLQPVILFKQRPKILLACSKKGKSPSRDWFLREF
ncbi:hypothetical protein PQX77_018857 [Marasmius sp. AFHP31]|nr:hypothetical protein PQX77_018857 [Marasmius sp. AFHP31]